MKQKKKNLNIDQVTDIKRYKETEKRFKSYYFNPKFKKNYLSECLCPIYLKFNLLHLYLSLKKEYYIKNFFKNKIYKFCFLKNLFFFLHRKAHLSFLSKKNQVQFDIISGEILNITTLNKKFKDKKNKFKISKKNKILVLFNYQFLIFECKTRKKIKKVHFLFKIKFMICRDILYILNRSGKIVVTLLNQNLTKDLILTRSRNIRSINLKKIIGCNEIIVIIKYNIDRIFIYFLKNWENIFFLRNPIFFTFQKLPNFIKFICIKKYFFIVLQFNNLILPFQITFNATCKIKQKHTLKPKCYKNISSISRQILHYNILLFKIQKNHLKKIKSNKQKKKDLILVFKNCKKKTILTPSLFENCLIKIKDLLKYKLYKNTISSNLHGDNLKIPFNRINAVSLNPQLTFLCRVFSSFQKIPLKNVFDMILVFKYHLASLKYNFHFHECLSKFLQIKRVVECEMFLMRAYVLYSC